MIGILKVFRNYFWALLPAISFVLLFAKFDISEFVPTAWGQLYATYAESLGVPSVKITYRILSPLIAHYLGFNTGQAWLYFLLLLFFFGQVLVYKFVYKKSGSLALATVLGLLTCFCTNGWYQVYFAGYPDAAMMFFLIVALVCSKRWLFYVAIALAIWTHERAIFAVPFIPLFRWLLNLDEPMTLKRFLGIQTSLGLIVVSYFLFRPLLATEAGRYSLSYYMNDLMKGGSSFAKVPLTPVFIAKVVIEGYKYLIIPAVFSVVILAWKRHWLVVTILVGYFFAVTTQLIIAVDSVRLIDMYYLGFLVLLFLAYQAASTHFTSRRAKSIFHSCFVMLVFAVCAANYLSPVTYLAQNMKREISTKIP